MTIKNKIRLLMCLVETYEVNKDKGSNVISDEFFIILFDHYCKQAMDKVWFNSIFQSFKQAVIANKSLHAWIATQFKPLFLFEASTFFKQTPKGIFDLHCLSFAHTFLGNQPDDYFCNFNDPINQRVSSYLKQKTQATSEENLKAGDIIAYKDKDEQWTHVGVYIGQINNEKYVISKFGKAFNVFLHPLDGVAENDKIFHCYSSRSLNSKALANLKQAELEIQERLSSSAHVLHSIFTQALSSQTDEWQPTDEFEFYKSVI